ncbi:MAG: ribosome silencing factor [Akkermansiaceae bacterium]|jgi:ribosome-associated protein|nr:ribosome silencing factor [Akkermansiaceae bacterium]|tara:strand:- start:134 stop:511 length:378 start_codon:yes stop_codon:yes gene_type:complete
MATVGQELAIACAKAAEEIQAEDIRVLDLQGLSSLTDFMVLCTGNSMPHLKAVLREVEQGVRKEAGAEPVYSDGKPDSRWVVLDYVDVMVHVLDEESRERYALEDLWGDAKEVAWGGENAVAQEA